LYVTETAQEPAAHRLGIVVIPWGRAKTWVGE